MIETYLNYVELHIKEIADFVNECFHNQREFLKIKMIRKIREYLTPVPVHYDWRLEEWNTYDYSGEIIENGTVSLQQTINSFLENEYSGNKEATYISHMGFSYNTYGDELRYYTNELGNEIMLDAMKRYIEDHFNTILSEEEFECIIDGCHDEIYDNCMAADFFFYEPAIEFVGIGGRKLRSVLT